MITIINNTIKINKILLGGDLGKMSTESHVNNIKQLIENNINNAFSESNVTVSNIYDIYGLRSDLDDSSKNLKSCKVYSLIYQEYDNSSYYYTFDFHYDTNKDEYIYMDAGNDNWASDIWNGVNDVYKYDLLLSKPTDERPVIKEYKLSKLGSNYLKSFGLDISDGTIVTDTMLAMIGTAFQTWGWEPTYHEFHLLGFITREFNLDFSIDSQINIKLTKDASYNRLTLFLVPAYVYMTSIASFINDNDLLGLLSYLARNYIDDKIIMTFLTKTSDDNYDNLFASPFLKFDNKINLGVSRINSKESKFWYNFGIRNKSYLYNEIKQTNYNYIPILCYCNDGRAIDLVSFSNYNLFIGDMIDISTAVKSLKIDDTKEYNNYDSIVTRLKIDGQPVPNDFTDIMQLKKVIAKQANVTSEQVEILSIREGSTIIEFKISMPKNKKSLVKNNINKIFIKNENINFKKDLANLAGFFDIYYINLSELGESVDKIDIEENKSIKIKID